MVDEALFSSLKKPLSDAQEIILFLPENPGYDRMASALGLYLSFKKAGKSPTILCSSPAKVEASDLVGVDKIKNEAPGQNLIATFDYVEDSIEKVSYHIEDQKFKLVIKPKAGFPPLAAENVDFSYVGVEADLFFLFGVRSPASLKGLTDDPEKLLRPEKTVLFDLEPPASSLAGFDIAWPAASFSEIAAYFINQMRLPADEDIASNLLKGIETATRSFSSPKVNATTFEAAAFCLRSGAKKGPARSKSGQASPWVVEEPKSRSKPAKTASDWVEPKIYNANTRI